MTTSLHPHTRRPMTADDIDTSSQYFTGKKAKPEAVDGTDEEAMQKAVTERLADIISGKLVVELPPGIPSRRRLGGRS